MPAAERLIEFSPENVFARFNLEDEIAALAIPKVQLPSGAWITIETTEALTAIDVNSGRFTQSESLEQTSFAVNLECAAEIGRQIRLRGIGGLIVVDFIHLSDPQNSAQVVAALEKSLSFDRAPVQVSSMAEFGIVAVTRKRVREPLARLIAADCPHCFGTGRAPSCESVSLDILRHIEREARAAPGKEILCEAAPEVTEWLIDREEEIRSALARRGAGRVRFAAGNFERDRYDIRPI
jgi:ribonuclease G